MNNLNGINDQNTDFINDSGLGDEISQLGDEIKGLYRFVSNKSPLSNNNTPLSVNESSRLDYLVVNLISDISSKNNTNPYITYSNIFIFKLLFFSFFLFF